MSDSKQATAGIKEQAAWRSKATSLLQNQTVLLAITLVVLGLFFNWGSGGMFLDLGTLGTVLDDWGAYILLAVGMTFVVITGGIDLSVGSTVSLSSVVAGWVMVGPMHADLSITGSAANPYLLLATFICLGVGLLVGAINAFLINIFKIVPFIATLATMGAAAGMAIIISGGMPLQGPNNFDLGLDWKIGDFQLPISTTVAVVMVITVIAGLFLHKSRFGLYTYALGSNAFATRGAGISPEKQILKVYLLSGGMAGLAGAYAYIRLGSGSPSNGMGMELYAIAATVIGGASLMGGVGRIFAVALGTLVLFVVQSGLLMMQVVQVSPDLKQVIVAILIAAAVAVQTLQNKNGRR
jgi:ribose transport system permease protein